MAIDFNPERWDKIKETYKLWWEGKLNRPIIPVAITGQYAGRPKPSIPLLNQGNCHDFSITPSEVIDRIDYELSTYKYLGDSFPLVNLVEFGPGILPLFCGAKLDNSSGHCWFFPQDKLKDISIKDIHLEYDPDNIWLNRIKNICTEAMERWKGQVMVGMPDMGGILDSLVTFRTNEKLMYDIFDYPEEVKRLTWEVHHLWFKFFEELNQILRPHNTGYCDWSTIYSDTPSYVLQCDFCFMIGPEMFDEFVKPELVASCKKLSRSIYHLDGSGQLPHLDSILEIPEVDAVQWVPDPNQEPSSLWSEVFRKINKAGKKIQIIKGDLKDIDEIIQAIGGVEGIHRSLMYLPASEEFEVVEYLRKFGMG